MGLQKTECLWYIHEACLARTFSTGQTLASWKGSGEALEAFFLLKFSFEDYRIFYVYSEEDSNAVSLMTIWSVQHFPVNFLGMGIQIHRQSCQNTVLVLLSKCETPIEITWSLSINFSLSWSNLGRNNQGKMYSATRMRNLKKKNSSTFGNFNLHKWPIFDTHFHFKMKPRNSCLIFKGTQNMPWI